MACRYDGYTGKILDIDLTTGHIGEYPVSDTDRERFLGGRFLSTKILWDELAPGTDPLSADNILIVMTSPLTGTGAPSSSRYDISAKSPLTGGIGHSNSGGNFGIRLKRAGWDGMVVRGKAAGPVYLDIHGESVRILPADHLWGLDTQAAQKAMGKGGTLAIGPAGENRVRFATVVSQERSHGRTGMGAVMGSKNLKGMVARGSHKIPLRRPEKFKATVGRWIDMLKNHPATGDLAPRYGTAFFLSALSRNHALPTRNFSQGTYADAHRISGERLADEFLIRNSGCVSCPIRCGRVVALDGQEVKGPEYEILCLMGSNLLVNDMEAIIRWNTELDRLGLDTITVGNVLGFAAELNEKGLWPNGIEFGQTEGISALLTDIAYRRGMGKDLSMGVRFLSEKYGGADFAAHVKGLEIAAYEPRASVGHALGYATANRGACHLDGGYMIYLEVTGPVTLDPLHLRSKPGWVILDQNLLAAISAGGNCLFTSWTFVPKPAFALAAHPVLSKIVSRLLTWSWPLIDGLLMLPPAMMKFHLPLLPHTRAIEQATGMSLNFGQFFQVGERGYLLERLFNLREGIGRSQDNLPGRFTREPLDMGKKASRVDLDQMLPIYYRLRGLDADGIPKPATLKRLGLDFINLAALPSGG
ncbi:MAG: aldehyde ferredoxin oxidoreductase family protein [Desulfobacterales bacterium]|nr:aldehyde ferredoxin oxidoreductase family protein [Desulfobacterales bacterium]